MRLSLHLIILAVLALLAWMFRYDISPGGRGMSHVIDRWTGEIYFVRARSKEPVIKLTPMPHGFDPTTAQPEK